MPKKVDNYMEEQNIVLYKIINILCGDNNNVFLLHDIDNNLEKQQQIYDLEPDIKKYFICSKWGCYKLQSKRKWLSLIKNICKTLNINITSATLIEKDNKVSTSNTMYKINIY